MCEYLAIFKCMSMSEWLFSSTLANYFLLADYSLIKLISDACFNLFSTVQTTAQIIIFSLDINIFTNKFQGLRHIKTQPVNLMAYRFDIKK